MREFHKVTVLGAGTMGPGIAQIMAIAGAEVVNYDIAEAALEKAKVSVASGLEGFVNQGTLTAEQAKDCRARISFTTDLAEAVKETDLVMEAVVEKAEVKISVYRQLDELLPEGVVIASNTSFLNIFELMPERRLPDTIIAHWYSPATMVPLVELCPNEKTKEGIVDDVKELLQKGGKMPVPMKKFIQGYIVNRLQMCLNQEVYYLLDHGYCTPEDIDIAVRASFAPRAMVLGILQKTDFGGLNMTANNYRNKSYRMPEEIDMPKILQEHIDRGETGVMAGKGYYDYTGQDLGELLEKRDEQLHKAYQLEMEFFKQPLQNAGKG